MTCHAHLFDGPLVCTNDAPEPHPHTYAASDAPDRHTEGGEEYR